MFFSTTVVGIDIGEYAIKIVELSRHGKDVVLKNYAWAKTPDAAKNSPEMIGQTVRHMMNEAGIKTRKAFFTISDASYFCTTFEIPPMPEKEIGGAVSFNASRYITMPVSQVTLDWNIISPNIPGNPIRIFATAIPNTIVDRYQKIAAQAGITLVALEAEAASLATAISSQSSKPICIVDIGAQSSIISIVDQKKLKDSYTFKAESAPMTDSLIAQIQNVDDKFFGQEHRHIEEIYLTGGGAAMPGLVQTIGQKTGKKTAIANCFTIITHPQSLASTLRDLSPALSGAVGVAMGGLQL